MSALPIRERLLQELDTLSEEQLVAVLKFIQALKAKPSPASVDTNNDPLVGFISGSTDAAERAKTILHK